MATSIILYSIPVFFVLIFIEIFLDIRQKTSRYRINDALTSLSLGIISRTKLIVIFSFASIMYEWASEHLAIVQLPANSWITWVLSFVFYDFLYYWYHRLSHQINFLWASHVVHHQSEDYNLTTALRQTSSSVLVWLFFLPSFVLGIPTEVLLVCGALNLVYQFWVHTQFVGKLGWIERIFVTPSHHRVHHGQNSIYIDKNHGGVFILWDRIFGTFQEELDAEPVVYGIRRPVNSFNPIWANIHTWVSLLKDSYRANSLLDKIKIWFAPTGWRPEDVNTKYPIEKQEAGSQVKFDPVINGWIKYYTIIQYCFCLVFALVFILSANKLDFTAKLVIWFVITMPLLTNGIFLNNRSYSRLGEGTRILFSIAVFFPLMQYVADSLIMLYMVYLILTLTLFSISLLKHKEYLVSQNETS